MAAGIEIELAYNRFPIYSKAVARYSEQVIKDVAKDALDLIVASMERAHSGEFYGGHQASAPGEAPAVVSGRLRDSITIDDTKKNEIALIVGEDYGILLEYGAPGAGIEPRPFVAPAVQTARKYFLPKYMKAFKADIEGA